MIYSILGIFTNRPDAEHALGELEEAGFNPKDMSIIMKDQGTFANVSTINSTGMNVAGGALSGAATGAVVGGLAGLLVGVGALTIPGLGAFLIGGPIALVLGLTGAAATTISGMTTGAVAGGILGALLGLGIPEEHAKVYEQHIQEGGILLAVPTDETDISEVKDILHACNAIQVRSFMMEPAIHRRLIQKPDETSEESVDEDDDIPEERNRDYAIPSYAYVGIKGGRTRNKLHDVLFGKEKKQRDQREEIVEE